MPSSWPVFTAAEKAKLAAGGTVIRRISPWWNIFSLAYSYYRQDGSNIYEWEREG